MSAPPTLLQSFAIATAARCARDMQLAALATYCEAAAAAQDSRYEEAERLSWQSIETMQQAVGLLQAVHVALFLHWAATR